MRVSQFEIRKTECATRNERTSRRLVCIHRVVFQNLQDVCPTEMKRTSRDTLVTIGLLKGDPHDITSLGFNKRLPKFRIERV